MINERKIYAMLGLATKAGKIASGEFMTEQSVKDGKALLVVVAEDASGNTKKNFSDMCTYYQVPFVIFGTKEQLGHAIGKEIRASLAVLEEGFVKSIQKNLAEQNANESKSQTDKKSSFKSDDLGHKKNDNAAGGN